MKFSEMSKEQLVELMSGKGLGSGVRGKKGGGRKEELLNMLKVELLSVKDCSIKMGISNRNVSSIVCYLKDDGYDIRNLGDKMVLWGKIVEGEKVGNRVEMGKKGKLVRFDFEKGLFEDEVKVEEKVKK